MRKKRFNKQMNDPKKLRKRLKINKKSTKNIEKLLEIYTKKERKAGEKSSFKKTLYSLLNMDKREKKEILSTLEKEEHIWKATPTLRGAMEISKAAGIKPGDVKLFVETKDLPAFKIYSRKFWFAFPEQIEFWKKEQAGANLFRATQTEEKLRRENIQGKSKANQTHYDVGAKVRQTIKELGGTMPEDLPSPGKGIKQLEREQKRLDEK
ncbi:hypothetical protein [Desulfobacter hydrogenophilus]|nr:hypothetical protein [Desulfobacter hydrogenophilus]